mmetsp:Transcript_3139/g.6670  ORF Transcript_3139/g.6670 Transcript_3139/m.6670 type:complete len:229 (-) Transcript_3139:185-871(-)
MLAAVVVVAVVAAIAAVFAVATVTAAAVKRGNGSGRRVKRLQLYFDAPALPLLSVARPERPKREHRAPPRQPGRQVVCKQTQVLEVFKNWLRGKRHHLVQDAVALKVGEELPERFPPPLHGHPLSKQTRRRIRCVGGGRGGVVGAVSVARCVVAVARCRRRHRRPRSLPFSFVLSRRRRPLLSRGFAVSRLLQPLDWCVQQPSVVQRATQSGPPNLVDVARVRGFGQF